MGAILWLPSMLFSAASPAPVDQQPGNAREMALPAALFHHPDTVSAGHADDRTDPFSDDVIRERVASARCARR